MGSICSNWTVVGWVRINPNVVQIIKSAQNNGHSLTYLAFDEHDEKEKVYLRDFVLVV